jgi:hypothetical protein
MVFDHTADYPSQWAAIRSVGEKLGIRMESLRRGVRQAERDADQRTGLTTSERDELQRLQRATTRRFSGSVSPSVRNVGNSTSRPSARTRSRRIATLRPPSATPLATVPAREATRAG